MARTDPKPEAFTFRAKVEHDGGFFTSVLVPERVSRALAPWATAGRVPVKGTVGGAPFALTLTPVGDGRHRLTVKASLRRAAGVSIGSTVTVALEPCDPEALAVVPPDLAAALKAEKGARAAFDELPLAHRREILRYLENARGPAARGRLIARAVAQVLGRETSAPTPARAPSRERWTCPSCGGVFKEADAAHDCVAPDVGSLFEGRPAALALFQRLAELVEECGPAALQARADGAAFVAGRRFLSAIPRKAAIDVRLLMARRNEHPRFRQVMTLTPDSHLHMVKVSSPGDFDDVFRAWLWDAYTYGCHGDPGGRSLSRGP